MNLPELSHPYCRYGLAVALESEHLQGRDLAIIDESELRKALADVLEEGLANFRLKPNDLSHTSTPKASDQPFQFRHLSLKELRGEAKLVQSTGLSSKGYYLCPTIICSEGSAKATFEQCERLVAELRDPTKHLVEKLQELKRSFVPVIGEINNGQPDKKNPRGTLYEAACGAIATVTPVKPSLAHGRTNSALFPDLPLTELREFVRVFDKLRDYGKGMLIGKIKADGKLVRPRIFQGNYPFGVSAEFLGAAGLLAAIGYWAKEAGEYDRAEAQSTLETMKDHPLYILGYDDCSQSRFNHHVITLAQEGALYSAIQAFLLRTRLYAFYEQPKEQFKDHQYKHLLRDFSHFLQFFDTSYFQGFLANRAEYPEEMQPLLERYFMTTGKIDEKIVKSASALGRWINQTAYIVARDAINPTGKEDWSRIDKEKAKVLIEFESAVFSSKDGADLLNRISVRTGRLTYRDIPAEATDFYEATAIGDELDLKQAQHLVVAFMRVSPPRRATNNQQQVSSTITVDGFPEVNDDDRE